MKPCDDKQLIPLLNNNFQYSSFVSTGFLQERKVYFMYLNDDRSSPLKARSRIEYDAGF